MSPVAGGFRPFYIDSFVELRSAHMLTDASRKVYVIKYVDVRSGVEIVVACMVREPFKLEVQMFNFDVRGRRVVPHCRHPGQLSQTTMSGKVHSSHRDLPSQFRPVQVSHSATIARRVEHKGSAIVRRSGMQMNDIIWSDHSIMESFNSIFVHYPQYQVIICKACRIGVTPSHVKGHLSRQHPFIPQATQDSVCKYIAEKEDIARSHAEIAWPNPCDEPIRELDVFKDGLRCLWPDVSGRKCGSIYRSKRRIQIHCSKQHGWNSARSRGRPKRGEKVESLPVEAVHCQQMFRDAGKWKQMFQVGESVQKNEEVHEEAQAKKRKLAEMIDIRMEAQQKRRMMIQPPGRYEANEWLIRTKWAIDLADMDPEQLVSLTKPKPVPERDESERSVDAEDAEEVALELVCVELQSMVFKAQAASHPAAIGDPANFYIGRREFGGESNEKPFYTRQMAKTIRKYAMILQKIVRLIWRVDEVHAGGPGPAAVADKADAPVESMPRFTLTTAQYRSMTRVKAMAREMVHSGPGSRESREKLSKELVQFWVSILDHDIKDRQSASALVGAMAVLGIDESGGWKSPLVYTPIQSAVVTLSKMIVLYSASLTRRETVERVTRERTEEGSGPAMARTMAEEVAPACVDLVRQMANRFMQITSNEGRPSPMDSILHLRAYGLAIRYHTTEAGRVDWNGDKLLHGDIEFTMGALRGMAFGMVEDSRALLFRDLLMVSVDETGALTRQGKAILPIIPWADLVDNPSQARAGWNMFMDKRNKWPVDGQTWLWDRVWQETHLRQQFVESLGAAGNAEVVWNEKRMRQYNSSMSRFRECLLVMTHMFCGQGSRGSEVLTIQHRNGDNGTLRGMFVEDGKVAMVTAYHKGFGSSGKRKAIHRYAPREVGELIMYDTWLVRPFWSRMGTIIVEPAEDGKAWAGEGPYFWQPDEEEDEEGDSAELDVDEEDGGGGGAAVEEQRKGGAMDDLWAPDIWDSTRVRRALRRHTLRWLGVPVPIMAWRHMSIAIFRKHVADRTVQQVIDEDDAHGYGQDAAHDLQAGHGTKVAEGIYARLSGEAPGHTRARRAAFRRVSEEWQFVLRFPSEMKAPERNVGPKASRIKQEMHDEQFRRWSAMRAVDLETQLKVMVGPTARFRGVQQQALQVIMQQKSPVVVIMGTGGGKSMLFMLPARCSTGLTVVVVPLVSLRDDLTDRCRRAGIDCVEWDARRPHEWAQVMMVTPEAAVREAFAEFLNRQQAEGRLDRVVVDECHVVLDSRGGWRKDILELRKLVKFETQLVYLTATLMPDEEREFIRCMSLPPKDRIQWFRASTERSNIAYRRVQCSREDEMSVLISIVERKKKQYSEDGKIVVYCGSVEQTKAVAAELGGICYHREAGTAEHKSRMLHQLKEPGGHRVFAATNALGLGVDAPTIRVVIHVGIIRRVRDYSQESGRAGRDGEPSEAIIINTAETEEGWQRAEMKMKEFVWSGECRRIILGRYMDGIERGVCSEEEQKCDACGGEEEAVESGIADDSQAVEEARAEGPAYTTVDMEQEMQQRRILAATYRDERQKEMTDEERLRRLMQEWSKGCVICKAKGEDGFGHMANRCPYDVDGEFWTCMERVRTGIRFERFSGCFGCGLWQGICDRWGRNPANSRWQRRSGVNCQYPGVLVRAVVAIWGEKGRCFVEDMDGMMRSIEMPDLQDVSQGGFEQGVQFLGKRWQIGEMETNRLVQMFLRWAEAGEYPVE